MYSTALADKNLHVVADPAVQLFMVFMNNTVAPLNNPKVREAVSLALDRQAFDQSQEGLCTPVGQTFAPGIPGYVNSLKPQTNIAEAKKLIQEAGATGATIKMVTITFEPDGTFAKLVQAQLSTIGLNVQITYAPGTFRVLYGQGDYGMMLTATTVTATDPSLVLDQYVLGQGNPGTKDPTVVAKIHQAEQLPIGSPQRTAAMEDLNKTLTNTELLWAPICQGQNIFVANKNVLGMNAMQDAAIVESRHKQPTSRQVGHSH
jgi:ABC-type transport system substrate-binding protein